MIFTFRNFSILIEEIWAVILDSLCNFVNCYKDNSRKIGKCHPFFRSEQ